MSIGHWGACKVCELLLDLNAWDAVLDRAVTMFFVHHPEFSGEIPKDSLREQLRLMYETLRTKGFKKIAL